MTTHNGILTPAQIETLRAVPTGHALDAQDTAQDKGRPHVYAGQNPRGTGEENPHARFARAPDPAPGAEALPVPGDTLGNGSVVLETAQTGARAYVLAFTGKGRAHPFAVWRLEIASRESADVPPSWGTYSGDYFARLGDALEGLKARTRGTVAA